MSDAKRERGGEEEGFFRGIRVKRGLDSRGKGERVSKSRKKDLLTINTWLKVGRGGGGGGGGPGKFIQGMC